MVPVAWAILEIRDAVDDFMHYCWLPVTLAGPGAGFASPGRETANAGRPVMPAEPEHY